MSVYHRVHEFGKIDAEKNLKEDDDWETDPDYKNEGDQNGVISAKVQNISELAAKAKLQDEDVRKKEKPIDKEYEALKEEIAQLRNDITSS